MISDPDFHVGSGMGTRSRGFLHAEPGVRDVKMSAPPEGIEAPTGERFFVTYLGKSVAS